MPRQTNRQAGRQADRQTDRQARRQTDRQAGRHTGRQSDQMGRQPDKPAWLALLVFVLPAWLAQLVMLTLLTVLCGVALQAFARIILLTTMQSKTHADKCFNCLGVPLAKQS